MRKFLKENGAKTAAGLLGFLLMPALSFILFEYVTGNLPNIAPDLAALNILLNLILYLTLFGLTGSTRVSIPASALILYFASLAETFVMSFRSRPIMIYDILAVQTAMSVAGNYEYRVTMRMTDAALLLLLACLILWFLPLRVRGLKKRLINALVCLGGAAALTAFFFLHFIPAWNLCINMWNVNNTYENEGFVLSTAVSLRYVVKKPPSGYSQARLSEIYARFLKEDAADETSPETGAEAETPAVQPVNLICIMNESLSDLRAAGDFSVNEEYFSYINSLTENTIRGQLCMPVFGAGTSNSEYEFLTGDSIQMLPACTNAYQFNVEPGAFSLVSTLKAQGYRAVALHPYPAENWNRDHVYENLGFDEFLAEEYFDGGETFRTFLSDRADYLKLIEQVESKESPDEKLFLFNVTMQNHGGYEIDDGGLLPDIHLTGDLEGKYPKTDQYLSLMKLSDDAFQFLTDYFRDCDQPTMIVLFGDHQPGVEDEFYDEIAGMPAAEVAPEDRLMWYETPFLIWTNYEQPSCDLGKLGSIFLSSRVLEAAGLRLTPYNRLLLALSEELPVVHILGCYDTDGTFYSWDEAETADTSWHELLLDYETAAYNHAVARKKIAELFTLP